MPEIPQPFSSQSVSNWIALLQHSDIADERFRALQAIGLLAPPIEKAQWAAKSLGDNDSTVRALAAKILGTTGIQTTGEVESQLVALLVDSDPDVQFESARTLIRQKSAQMELAVPVLLRFLDESETQPLMIASVVNAIVDADLTHDMIEGTIRPRLQRLLDHERAEVREAVSIAFAKWPKMARSCFEQLIPLLDDSEPIVREKIAYTFGQAGIANAEIRAALQVASEDEDSEVARIALEALKHLEAVGEGGSAGVGEK